MLRAADGSPVPHAVAHLTISDAVRDEPASDDGTLNLPDVPLEAICVSAPGFQPVALAAGSADDAVVMQRGVPLVGSVKDAATNAPVAGTILRLHADEPLGPCARQGIADAKGQWRIDGLPPRQSITIDTIAAPGHVVPAAQRVVAGEGRRLDLRLHAATSITVTVSGPDGKPLAGAELRILPEWRRRPLDPILDDDARKAIETWRATTDATGSAALPTLPQREWRIVATHPALAPASVTVSARKPLAAATVKLGAGSAIQVRAIAEDESPVAGAVARVIPVEGDDLDLAEPSASAGVDGIARLRRVPPGRLAVEVTALGMRPEIVRGVESKHGATIDLGDVTLVPGVPIAGRVTHAGEGIMKAKIVMRGEGTEGLEHEETESVEEGAFRFEGLDPDWRGTLRVTAEGYAPTRLEHVVAGTTDVAIDMNRAATIVAEVRDAKTHEAVAGVHGTAAGDSFSAPASPQDDDPTLLRFTDLPPGTYSISASAPGHLRARKDDVEAKEGEEARVSLELGESRQMPGLVVESDTRRPIEGARVSLEGSQDDVASGPDGTFTLDVPEGPISVSATHPSHAEAHLTPVDVSTLPAEGLVIPMERGASLEGHVFDREGKPLQGALVRLEAEDQRSTLTDADGHYRLDGLKPETTMVVKVDRPGTVQGRESAPAHLVADATTTLDFGTLGRIHGRVTYLGEPLAGIQVSLMQVVNQPSDDPHFELPGSVATTDAEGNYELTGVHEGPSCMQLAWRKRKVRHDVTLPTGVHDLAHDVEFPDLHLAGTIVDGETHEPLAGAVVMLYAKAVDADKRAQMSTSTSEANDDGSIDVSMSTTLGSDDESASDGSFNLPVQSPGTWQLTALYFPDRRFFGTEVSITSSRDDYVIELKAPDSAQKKLHVTMLDDASGQPLAGSTFVIDQRGSSIASNGGDGYSGEYETSMLPMQVGCIAPGHGLAVATITAQSAGDKDVNLELRLKGGGSMRLLLPPGALADGPCAAPSSLSLKLDPDWDLVMSSPRWCKLVTTRMLEPGTDGDLLVRDLPAGPVTVSYGGGAPHVVEIVAGETAEVDLR